MKLKTNLTARELELVSKGLSRLAKQQVDGTFVPENEAERELLSQSSDTLNEMLDNLKVEISNIFGD